MFARFLTFRSVLGEKMPTPIDAKLAKERRPQTQTHTEEPRVQDDDPENLFCVFRQIAREVAEGNTTEQPHFRRAISVPLRTKLRKRMSL